MTDLLPDDKALIDQAREGLEPSTDDRARVRGALAAQLAIGALAAAAGTSAAGAAAAGTSAAGAGTTTAGTAAVASSSLALRVLALAVIMGTIGTGAAIYSAKNAKTSSGSLSANAPVAAGAAAQPPSGPAATARAAEDLVVPGATEPAPSASTPAAGTARPASGRAGTLTKTESSTVDPEGALTAETRLIGNANAALQAGDAARALSLLDEHARRFPGGVLAEERDAERVLALCAAGRTSDARARAERFLRERPRSALAPKVRTSCGGP